MNNIYISPSRQPANVYTGLMTNEEETMRTLGLALPNEEETMQALGLALSLSLARVGFSSRVADRSTPLDARIEEAQIWGADYYVCLHSNASSNGKALGTNVFLGAPSSSLVKLAQDIVTAVQALMPYKPTVSGVHTNYTKFKEIREPDKRGMRPIYIEVEFHDNPAGARFIIDRMDDIAESIAGVMPYEGAGPRKPAEVKRVVWRVYEQVGSYTSQVRAVAHRQRLQREGRNAVVERKEL